MTFSSLTFLLFVAVVFAAYWLVGRRRPQNLILLVASYVFYGWWDWRFCGLVLASSLIDFGLGWAMYKAEHVTWRRIWLAATLVSNLTLLGFFKYYNFFADSFAEAAGSLGWDPGDLTLNIILPIGISFYTFQTLSYTIDIYRRQLTPSRDLVEYLTFVSFFPQLVAGPIERATAMLPQFARDRSFDPAVAADGLRQMLWGLFKKLAVADRLALLVEPAYSNPQDFSGMHLTFATVCFAFQIYCDFSGYSDIAVGCSKQFGIQLSRNFAYPYFSQSLREFWRRWHISLSTWFRDYVFIPLGGSRIDAKTTRRNLILTFLISGFWHGAAWTYLVWGGLHGLLVALPHRRERVDPDEPPAGHSLLPSGKVFLRMATTFTAVCLCWVFFRASTWSDALLILSRIIKQLFDLPDLVRLFVFLSVTPSAAVTVAALALLVTAEWLRRDRQHPLEIHGWPQPARWLVYTAAMWGTILLIPEGAGQEFIYFDF